MIEVMSSGALNLVQDLGRSGCMAMGVSRSGAMDVPALMIANWLVGNNESAAGLEVNIFPFRFKAERELFFSCTGAHCALSVDGHPVPTWTCLEIKAGQQVVVERPSLGVRAYLAFSGGIDSPVHLGSRATDLKAGFGGHEGRGLSRGDRLSLQPRSLATACLAITPLERVQHADAMRRQHVTVRAIAAAQADEFSSASLDAFYSTPYEVTPQANRVGYRLQGQPLQTHHPIELLSHGIAPGTVQVPPAGQPIVQLAEANTCGGYPKIATVLDCDLWRLAQAGVGCSIHFKPISVDEGIEALTQHRLALANIQRHLGVGPSA
ncbi:biotin-dependent carboxyltransferase family protein [Pseudomonas sp. GD03817]|uniref:Biotin-dependent carboxyltransferase family protein n=1 Tax=Pseudomonas asiatica TaxID=2219225 RepID=A0AAJ5I0Q2_9PSED|nr:MULTISPECIES: biotin-dependent carboxyltransferase family protein [Pseudomonas]MCE0990466.1 biotin-dependent carboxyltransferase family protein [Pseudomonas alloputida]MDH1401829.1 biotin-dependent carboxyltransferase family protein [Pseudomonas sp. GD03730]MDH1776594.1 biotin-dependent carboxyltransferase family protein [Pseudomonas sp. GD03817]MEE1915479.1 biotin-dependent carboxyltransferase family protein [Pseudomonas asiatica]QKL10243.1 5-oxoprolinase/urea amidolyase family protein [Ps